MQDDQFLKELLSTAGKQQTSPAFTASVMDKIKLLEATRKQATPLVNPQWVRWYKRIFIAVVVLLLALSAATELLNMPYTIHVQLPSLVKQYKFAVVQYIIAFWILIGFATTLSAARKKQPR